MYYITDPINKLLAMLITLLLGPMLCHTDRNAGQCLVQRREMAWSSEVKVKGRSRSVMLGQTIWISWGQSAVWNGETSLLLPSCSQDKHQANICLL